MILQYEPLITEAMKNSVKEYIDSGGWITEFKKTRELEKKICRFTGSKYCIITTSGTIALFLSVLAVSNTLAPSSMKRYIAVPDYTMIASANATLLASYVPVLFDIEKETHCMTPHGYDDYFKKCNIIMLPSLNGRYPKCFDEIFQIAKENNIPIIEDSCQSMGSYHDGKHIGTYGDIGAFSFSMPKIITTGQGGAIITDNKELYDKINLYKDFGRETAGIDRHITIGYNFKFTDIQAILGLAQMKDLKRRIKIKRNIYKIYKEQLDDVEDITMINNSEEVTPWFIDILCSNPDGLKEYLKHKEIGTRRFYPAIHTQSPYNRMVKEHEFKNYNSLYISSRGLWLPSSFNLNDEKIIGICDSIKDYYK